MKLMVLDGNSLVNRAFFGIKLLTTKDGRYTNAIYGFQNILLNLLAAHKPDAVAISFIALLLFKSDVNNLSFSIPQMRDLW